MKNFYLIFLLLFIACGTSKSLTTETKSSAFSKLNAKIEFLEKYLDAKYKYVDLNFFVSYRDGSDGGLPSPTEYFIGIYATVPIETINEWQKDFSPTEVPVDTAWINLIPNTSKLNVSEFKWYKKDRKYVATKNNEVIYYIWSN